VSELLGAKTDTLDRVAESLRTDARRVQDIRTLAQRAVAELQASWNGPDLMHLTQQWEQQGSPQLAGVSASLDTCAALLRAQSAAQKLATNDGVSNDGVSNGGRAALLLAAIAPGLMPAPSLMPAPESPPKRGSPSDNATWWSSLGPAQQQRVIQDHPDWIGNRDGVAFTARDQANRAMLIVYRADLETERKRLEADLDDNWFGGVFTHDDAALEHVKDKLASIDAIEKTLNENPGTRQLLLLDMSQQRAQAAVAHGDVDTAHHVAVYVPGFSTTVGGSLQGADAQMAQMQHRAELESKRVTPLQTDETVTTATMATATMATATMATVTWIGYQAPQRSELIGSNSVLLDQAAKNGAAQLVPFLQGIDSARTQDAHLTVFAHSYGSTTAGLALRQVTGVDDAVFFGSPGLHTSHAEDLQVPTGHLYYIEARRDMFGDLGAFGIDPSHLPGIEHLSAKESAVLDPVTGTTELLAEATNHTAYLDNGSTSQYNAAVIMAGVAERRIQDGGMDIGDFLSWPVPGTGRMSR
jgi:Alpha/beta hydrolase